MFDSKDQLQESGALARLRGRSKGMDRLREALGRIAPLDSTLLLTGETGSGKGVAARAVHDSSPRADRPFVHVDCAALSPTLIESELFGHEKGAFTNAAAQRCGRFEWARDGTVFLDEIGDLEPRLQTKLLRVLDDRAFERLGGTQTLRMRARVIAATSHDLRRAVRDGRFRPDLYFRLSVFHLSMPPLRDRLEDLPELVADGIPRLSRRLGLAAPIVSDEFLTALAAHRWPGNVRELLNALERVVVARTGERLRAIDLADVLDEDLSDTFSRGEPGRIDAPEEDWRLPEFLREVEAGERNEIIAALQASRGCIAAAARRLRIPRSTLRHRMKKHGISEP